VQYPQEYYDSLEFEVLGNDSGPIKDLPDMPYEG